MGTAGHAGDSFCPLAGVVEQDCLGFGVVVYDGCEQPGRCRFGVFLVLGVGHMEQQGGVRGCPVLVQIDLREGPAGEILYVSFRGSECFSGDRMVAVAAIYWMKYRFWAWLVAASRRRNMKAALAPSTSS